MPAEGRSFLIKLERKGSICRHLGPCKSLFLGSENHVNILNIYPSGNQHIPYQGTFQNDFPFPKVGYVSSLEGTV